MAAALVLLAICSLGAGGCATSPTGRSQLKLFPATQIVEMGLASYDQIKKKTPIVKDPAVNRYVQCVVQALAAVVGPPREGGDWEVNVFDAPKTVNAFALPGGRVGVYSGILKVARTPGELAAVVGHEMGHVEADHANERLSDAFAAQTGVALVAAVAGGSDNRRSREIMGLLGVGATVGIILPFSRAQESEADRLGLHYMAQAGFDPTQAIDLWKAMMKTGGARPPELLSTHPADATRILKLEQAMPHALELYREARANGRAPRCEPPATNG